MGIRQSPISKSLEDQVKSSEKVFVAGIKGKCFSNLEDMQFFNQRTDVLSNALIVTTLERYYCAVGSLNRMIPLLKKYAVNRAYEPILQSARALKQALQNGINYDQTPFALPIVEQREEPYRPRPMQTELPQTEYTQQPDTSVPQEEKSPI